MSKNNKMCIYCNKIFSSKQMTKLHIYKKTCLKRGNFFCPKCNKNFKNNRNLKRHAEIKKNCIGTLNYNDANKMANKILKNSNTEKINELEDSSNSSFFITIMRNLKEKKDTFLLNSDLSIMNSNDIQTRKMVLPTPPPDEMASIDDSLKDFLNYIDYDKDTHYTTNYINKLDKKCTKNPTELNTNKINKKQNYNQSQINTKHPIYPNNIPKPHKCDII